MRKTKIIIMLSVIATVLNSCFLFNSSEVDNSLLPVRYGEKWGYINQKGKVVINPQFDDAGFFRNGLARVENSNKIGYIDRKGKIVIPIHYDDGTNFYEGKAFVVQPESYPLCIDKNGNTLFSLKDAKYAFGFSNGMAKIAVEDEYGALKYGFVNEKGEMVIVAQYDAARSFSDGFAAVKIDEKWGFINKKGEIIIMPHFDHVHDFHNGLARFTNGEKWGFVDKNGNYAINPHFEWCEDFNNEYALVQEGGKYGYVDKKGKYTIIPQFEWSSDFHNGLAQFKLNDKYGYINKSGQMVIMAQFDEATDFFLKNLAFVRLEGKYGLIDTKGKFCTTPQVDYVHRFLDNRFDEVMDPYEPFLSDGFWVSSQYYDASRDVALILNNYNVTSTSFDGFNVNTTLQNIVDNPKYGDYANCPGDGINVNDDENKVVTILNEKTLEDIKYDGIHVVPLLVIFQNPICRRNDYYSSKEYSFDEKMSGTIYLFFTGYGKCYGKSKSIKEEIKKQIATKANVTFKELATYEDIGLDAALSDKINFAIANIEDDEILLFVGFDKYSQSIIKKWANNIEDFIDDVESL